MFWRRVANLCVIVTVVTVSGGTHPAVASTVSAQAGKGAVDLTVSSDSYTSNYTVNFRGPITDHGWSYSGTLTGVGSTWAYSASMNNTPILSMTSDDGTVSGTCVGFTEGADDVTTATIEMDFGCVLSRNGGTPWQISLPSTIVQDTSGAPTWTGSYAEAVVATPQVNVKGALTYGDVQFGSVSSWGAEQLGPLRFSGQIAIGGTLYRGDLVSGLSDVVTSDQVPPLAVSGSSNGVNVSGTCNGAYDETLSQVGVTSYEFTCALAVGSAAPVTVSLRTVLGTFISGCSDRDCWGDGAGYFVAG